MLEFRFVNVDEIISLLPNQLIDELAVEFGVNKYAKKLQGQLLLKLLIHCILTHKENSLRSMESAYESIAFGLLNSQKAKGKIRYSSISERISTMNYMYFEKIFYKCVEIYGSKIGEASTAVTRFDSTIIATSGKLLKVGYHLKGDSSHLRQLKYTIGLSDIPFSADVYSEQIYTSENAALKESILMHTPLKENAIRVFDRGITSRATYDKFTDRKTPFVTRGIINSKHDVLTKNALSKRIYTDTLIITSDIWINLYSVNSKPTKHPIRCIKAIQKTTKEIIWFYTNIPDLNADEIANIYRKRWDIETFFKFIKQELNVSHLINRSENGVRVVLYSTLIAAILLLVYKKTNGLSGFKIVKQRFLQELEKELVRHFVIMTGGDATIYDSIVNNTS